MEHKIDDQLFLDYLEGVLPDDARSKLEAALAESSELAEEFRAYRAFAKLEDLIAQEECVLDEDLSEHILAQLEQQESYCEKQEAYFQRYRALIGGLICVNAALVAVLALLLLRGPVSVQHYAAMQPHSQASAVPAGFRQVTIDVTMPKKFIPRRADIRVAYEADGRRELRDLARFAKIIEVQDAPDSDVANARLTFLVHEEDAKKITLARLLGDLDLLLTVPAEERQESEQQEAITIRDPQGRTIMPKAPRSTFAVLYLPDGHSQTPLRHVFYNGDWHRHADMRVVGF